MSELNNYNGLNDDYIKNINNFFINKDDSIIDDSMLVSNNIDDDVIEKSVILAYKTMLSREPDVSGLKHYCKMIKGNKITLNSLYKILENSDEYKSKVASGDIVKVNVSDIVKRVSFENDFSYNNKNDKLPLKLVYCMMGTNRLFEFEKYVKRMIKHVDKFIFIDGGSVDDSVSFLNEVSKENNDKIHVIVKQWKDKFSEQRNNYLSNVSNIINTEINNIWVLVSDTDEHYDEDTLLKLKNLIHDAEEHGYNGIKLRVRDVFVEDNDYDKVKSSNLNEYWKSLVFKFDEALYYEGEPHETLKGVGLSWLKTECIYEHRRSSIHILMRAVENFFISNSNRYSEKWAEFRYLCTVNNILMFNEFMDMFNKGTLHETIENWIYNHRNDKKDGGDSEVREMAILYYDMWHPDKKDKREIIKDKEMLSNHDDGLYSKIRNFFDSNSERKSPDWKEFRSLCNLNNIFCFDDFIIFIEKGRLPDAVEKWILIHRNDEGNLGDDDIRILADYYFKKQDRVHDSNELIILPSIPPILNKVSFSLCDNCLKNLSNNIKK